ncbi:MAG: DUF4286 family protein [Gemmatimonadaceae bacterium]|nr:DUF4286 family protein [Gemmatimonadaceae bacterium]
MIIYEVTTDVAAAAVAEYEVYMRHTHIPAVLATGCFVGATIARAMPGRYRIRYQARNMDVLDRYLSAHAAQFRDDFAKHLGATVQVSREVWTELQHWDATGAGKP